MRLSDQKTIEFLAKSPVRSFAAMLDALRYLDGQWIPEGIEYELFNWGMGDNPEGAASLRVPSLGGMEANALFAFSRHAAEFHLVRRRTRRVSEPSGEPEDLLMVYEITAVGRTMMDVLRAIERVVPAE